MRNAMHDLSNLETVMQARRASVGPAALRSVRRDRLVWSEYWYLLALVVAAIVVVDPLNKGLATLPLTKHMTLMISLPAVLLSIMGWKLRASAQMSVRVAQLNRALWPILLLGIFITVGSSYARFVDDLQSTFLDVGLYMLTSGLAAMMVLQSAAPATLMRAYFRILLTAAGVMGVALVMSYGVREVYHEQAFLVIPMAAFFVARPERKPWHWLCCFFFLSLAWFSHKYTSYLIAILTMLYLAYAIELPRLSGRTGLYRTTVLYWGCLVAIVVALAAGYVAMQFSDDMPTGNPDYRMHTYAAAWERFTDSPVWGTLFAAESVEKFTLYTIKEGNTLPTHSDVMDLLAHGGIIAIGLWLYGITRAVRLASRNLLGADRLGDPCALYGHVLALMTFAGIVTYAFNPILLQPSMAYLLWTNFGMLVGLALRAQPDDAQRPHRRAPPRPGMGNQNKAMA